MATFTKLYDEIEKFIQKPAYKLPGFAHNVPNPVLLLLGIAGVKDVDKNRIYKYEHIRDDNSVNRIYILYESSENDRLFRHHFLTIDAFIGGEPTVICVMDYSIYDCNVKEMIRVFWTLISTMVRTKTTKLPIAYYTNSFASDVCSLASLVFMLKLMSTTMFDGNDPKIDINELCIDVVSMINSYENKLILSTPEAIKKFVPEIITNIKELGIEYLLDYNLISDIDLKIRIFYMESLSESEENNKTEDGKEKEKSSNEANVDGNETK